MDTLITVVRGTRFVFQYIVALIAVPIYLVFLWMIFKYRKHHQFNNSFFALISACGTADILYFIHYFITFRIPSMGYLIPVFYSGGIPLATFSTIGLTYWLYAQVLGVLMMSFNRFTALTFPAKHDFMWRKEKTLKAIVAQFLGPLVLIAPLAIRCQYQPDLRRGNTTLGVKGADPSLNGLCAILNYGLLTIVCMCAVVVLVFMYLTMFYKTWKHSHKVMPNNRKTAREQRTRKVQFNLALSGFVISVSLFLVGIHRGVGAVFEINPSIYYALGSIATTTYCLINPFALLATSRKVRAYFIITLKSVFGIKPTQTDLARLNMPLGMGTKTGKFLGLRQGTNAHRHSNRQTARF